MTTALRDRDQATVGIVTLVLMVAAILLAFFSKELPFLGGGTTYAARFTESAGLAPGSDVQLAGVKVGEVTEVELKGNRVLVHFTVDGAPIGDQTRVSIQIKTLLGAKNLALEPRGRAEQDPDNVIPAAQTEVPFDIPDALDQLTRATERLDTDQLARSFQVLSTSLNGTPQHLGGAVDGLSALSQSIASRDQQLADLLHNASGVSKVAADRNQEVDRLVSDGNLLLAELQHRRESISSLLRGTQTLSDQLRGMIADNQAQLNPALRQLEQLTSMLHRNQDNLGRTIAAMEPYVTGFNNTVGNGRWFEGYLCGLLPPLVNAGPVTINPEGCDPTGSTPQQSSGGG